MMGWLAHNLHFSFFYSGPVRTALLVGGSAAVVSAVIGVFTILRGHAFAGHALGDVSSAGGSASFLLGISPLAGFLGIAAIAAVSLEFLGLRRVRDQDIATGIVLGAGLGLSALFLYFDVTTTSTTGAAVMVMFGSMFALPSSLVWPAIIIALLGLGSVTALYRPLLLSVTDPELAATRGISNRWVGILHLLTLAGAVALAALSVGSVLASALLIGPAATALRISRRPVAAILWAVIVGLSAVWGGIWLAYESYYWFSGKAWPVSFFVVAIIFAVYLLSVPCQHLLQRRVAAHLLPQAGS
ncbi:MAG: metal ABC transporter permease [Phycisphaerae bacterium]